MQTTDFWNLDWYGDWGQVMDAVDCGMTINDCKLLEKHRGKSGAAPGFSSKTRAVQAAPVWHEWHS